MSAELQISETRTVSDDFLARSRNYGLLVFAYVSIAISMSVSQYENVPPGSLRYWALISIALLVPMLDLGALVRAMVGVARPLMILAIGAIVWWFLLGDPTAVKRLVLLVWIVTWLCSTRAVLQVNDVVRLYFFALILGVLVLFFTDLNEFSLIPGRANPDLGELRVSFFPNVANTGVLSLCLFLILTKNAQTAWRYRYVLALVTYFLVFSFVRTAFVAAAVYLLSRWLIGRIASGNSRRMFIVSVAVTCAICLGIAFSASILFAAQDLPLVASLFLRGESGIPIERIEYQLYRPWLWAQQWNLFWTSPYLMGWGSTDFMTLVSKTEEVMGGKLVSAGTESLPLRLLVEYGVLGLLFVYFLFKRLASLSSQKDEWACACFPALFTLIMTWGVFHPSDIVFVLFMMILTKGTAGYSTGEVHAPSRVQHNLDTATAGR